ncbi:ferredoxin family protein [Phaeovibrio sulfidiphilus]|uniref:Ferredoxin-like protein n=1 Tax=Phaeovibrio sulfidiphilus TaxID=1220600 RepID=A0A8J6YLR9_9PROT|nr:ferredoxin family protein [Phaeovibrio sulfidiphilus]MBE1237105.1 ferredoxin family protein [Phaeovibrio sulfidiphilus]
MTQTQSQKIEEKLYQNRYRVEEGKPHITIVPEKATAQELKMMAAICPAACYEETENGKVEIIPDGCLECGTCRVVCQGTGSLTWNYPSGGYGILFKFG